MTCTATSATAPPTAPIPPCRWLVAQTDTAADAWLKDLRDNGIHASGCINFPAAAGTSRSPTNSSSSTATWATTRTCCTPAVPPTAGTGPHANVEGYDNLGILWTQISLDERVAIIQHVEAARGVSAARRVDERPRPGGSTRRWKDSRRGRSSWPTRPAAGATVEEFRKFYSDFKELGERRREAAAVVPGLAGDGGQQPAGRQSRRASASSSSRPRSVSVCSTRVCAVAVGHGG